MKRAHGRSSGSRFKSFGAAACNGLMARLWLLKARRRLARSPGHGARRVLGCVFVISLLVAGAFGQNKPAAASKEFQDVAQRAAAAREANRDAEAIDLYKKALALNPRWDEGWWYLGTLYYDGNQYAEGLKAFTNLVELDPKMGPGWAMLGLCEFETHDYKNSLIHLERGRGLGLGKNDELINVTRFHAGLVLNLAGHFEAANELLSSLWQQGVASDDVVVGLGLCLLRVPLLPQQVEPSKDALVHAAGELAGLLAQGNFDQADVAFQKILKDYPDTPFLHYAYGNMLVGISRFNDAEKQFEEEMKITPESAMPYMQLAYVKLRLRQERDALPLADKAAHMAPQSFGAHYLLGRTLLELGQMDGAIRELEIARRLGPYSPEVRYNLSRAYSRAGRKEEAARERKEFARLNSLLQKEQAQTGGQSYRASGDRGNLQPHEVQHPPDSSPP